MRMEGIFVLVYVILMFLDVFGTMYLMFWSMEQYIKHILDDKYDKLFEKSFLYGVVIIPFILTIIFIVGLLICDKGMNGGVNV